MLPDASQALFTETLEVFHMTQFLFVNFKRMIFYRDSFVPIDAVALVFP